MDAASGEVVAKYSLGDHRPSKRVFSNDDHYFADVFENNEVRIFDLTKRVWSGFAIAPGQKIVSLQFNIRMGQIVLATEDGSISRWDLTTGKRVGGFVLSMNGTRLSGRFSPDGETFLHGRKVDGGSVVNLEAVETGQTAGTIAVPPGRISRYFSPDGKLIALWSDASDPSMLTVWRTTDGGAVTEIALPNKGGFPRISFSSDSFLLVVAWGADISVREAATGRLLQLFTGPSRVVGFAISRDSRYLVGTFGDGNGLVWDLTSGYQISQFNLDHAGGNVSRRIAFSPDGRFLVAYDPLSVAHQTLEKSKSGSAATPPEEEDDSETVPRYRWFSWQPEDLLLSACKRVWRNFTGEEWNQFLVPQEYGLTCTTRPREPLFR